MTFRFHEVWKSLVTLTRGPREWIEEKMGQTREASEVLHRGNYMGDFYYEREQRAAVVTYRGFVV